MCLCVCFGRINSKTTERICLKFGINTPIPWRKNMIPPRAPTPLIHKNVRKYFVIFLWLFKYWLKGPMYIQKVWGKTSLDILSQTGEKGWFFLWGRFFMPNFQTAWNCLKIGGHLLEKIRNIYQTPFLKLGKELINLIEIWWKNYLKLHQ